jgi:glucose-6-phosphate isomerase
VSDLVASRISDQDPTLWGPDAEAEAGKRLGWTEAVVTSEPLVDDIIALRDKLHADGVDHVVLGGMGGSSLAPEVITRTAGVELTILDSTDPGQILAALADRLATTVVVISSKSGSTLETASQRKSYEEAFHAIGIDPAERIVVVTDPGSPLDSSARAAGYRVFNADPNVGGRYSALTAFGLVPSGLAGADIRSLLAEASAVTGQLMVDQPDNPGLILGAAIAGTKPLKDKVGIVADGTYIVGFGDWVEQLIAESTGKNGKGLLPVVLDLNSPELTENLADMQIVRLVESARATRDARAGEIEISGTLGAQLLVWEYAVVVAGRLLGIDPFDQPDVESAKIATRALLDSRPDPVAPVFTADGIEVRGSAELLNGVDSIAGAIDALVGHIGPDGYLAVQAYVDRHANHELARLRDLLAAKTGRPVTFGWGPRFLHSTGQYHKGGPATGVFLQITATAPQDLEIPESPFSYGYLIQAQAAGDASVLAEHGRPVITLTLTEPTRNLATLFSAVD